MPQGGVNRFLMLPDHGFFSVPAIFVGLLLGLIPMDLLWRLLLKEKYVEFILYGNLANGFDTWKVTKVLAIVILIPSVIFNVLIMDSYVRFTNDQIISNRFWGFGETAHNYSQVVRIKSVRFRGTSDAAVENPYHVVYFNDGSIWSTSNYFYRADQNLKLSAEKEKVILTFVAEKCGKQIEQYDFLNMDEGR